jgi:hypothetical protein
MREVNTRRLDIIYYNYTITQISHCVGWQISPGSLPGFSARHSLAFYCILTVEKPLVSFRAQV